MRVVQPEGTRGSLKWIQRAVNDRWPTLNDAIGKRLDIDPNSIEWVSPLAADNYAEYRDNAFLERIGQSVLSAALAEFWPARGPQWDALGRTADGHILLVEAKAHVPELCSPGTSAREPSLQKIKQALEETERYLGVRDGRAAWSEHFYQLANRLAHLYFLRRNDIRASLVLVNFLGDRDIGGPDSREAWEAAYEVAFHTMGIPKRHPLASSILHVYPRVKAG